MSAPLLLTLLIVGQSAGETVITGSSTDDARTPIVREDASAEETLEALPEVTLLRTGGPLSPMRVDVRGLSGPRVGASVAGLELGGPSSGLVDVGLLPWVGLAATHLDAGARSGALGGQLTFEPLDASWPRAAARVGVGTLDTLDLGLLAGAPFGSGRALIAASAGRTNGAFVFRPTSPTGELRPPTVRVNNDQARAALMVVAGTRLLGLDADVLALLGGREGGIPGFASAPTDTLRGRRGVIGARLSLAQTMTVFSTRLLLDAHASARAQHNATRPARSARWDTVTASSLSAGLGTRWSELPLNGALTTTVDVERSAIVQTPFRRTGAHGVVTACIAPWSWWRLSAAARGGLLDDVGPLWGGSLSTTLGPSWLAAGATLSRAARAPTLDELYAPQGLVVGNPDLRPEAANELELFATSRLSSLLRGRMALFGGRIDEAILWVNRNAFEIAATNTGGLWRAGAEGLLELTPHRLVGLRAAGRLMVSHLDVTSAPMPVTPPASAQTTLRLGRRRGPQARVKFRFRSASTGSLYGTVPVPGYAMTDLVGRLPIGRHFLLVATVSNLFDALGARDLNGLPLPGRQFFASLEATL